jgi:hypothetical protein
MDYFFCCRRSNPAARPTAAEDNAADWLGKLAAFTSCRILPPVPERRLTGHTDS